MSKAGSKEQFIESYSKQPELLKQVVMVAESVHADHQHVNLTEFEKLIGKRMDRSGSGVGSIIRYGILQLPRDDPWRISMEKMRKHHLSAGPKVQKRNLLDILRERKLQVQQEPLKRPVYHLPGTADRINRLIRENQGFRRELDDLQRKHKEQLKKLQEDRNTAFELLEEAAAETTKMKDTIKMLELQITSMSVDFESEVALREYYRNIHEEQKEQSPGETGEGDTVDANTRFMETTDPVSVSGIKDQVLKELLEQEEYRFLRKSSSNHLIFVCADGRKVVLPGPSVENSRARSNYEMMIKKGQLNYDQKSE